MPLRLQLKIALDRVKPAVWRRVVVDESLSFAQLHAVIQAAMGWDDSHLHQFEVGGTIVGMKMDDPWGDDIPKLDEAKVRLRDLVADATKFRYWYDFGDDWWHTITIEKFLPEESGAPPAVLVAGKNACPPDDCGGPWGYADLCAALADPQHPEHESMLDWCGEFDPKEFELDEQAELVAHAVRPARRRKAAAAK